MILEFEGVTDQEYDAVNDELGIDMGTGRGDWPEGLLTHSAGLNEYGHLVVLEVWDTPEHQVRFMEDRLGRALARGGITGPPSRVTWIELVSHHPVVVLSGPSFAGEVAQQLPTAVLAASADARATASVQAEFRGPFFRLYGSDDVVGVEIGGAMKHVIAIAAGVVEGLGLGHNALAALITRGLA